MRGRKPKGEYAEKGVTLSTRIRSDTRAALEEAAKASGRSLSQECEHRLRRSFDEDEALIDRLGGRQLYAMFRMIAAAMELTVMQWQQFSSAKDERFDWIADPFGYDQAMKAAISVMDRLRPPGDPTMPAMSAPEGIPQEIWDTFIKNSGKLMAGSVAKKVAEAEPGQPLPDDRRLHVLMARIADALGPMQANLANRHFTEMDDDG